MGIKIFEVGSGTGQVIEFFSAESLEAGIKGGHQRGGRRAL